MGGEAMLSIAGKPGRFGQISAGAKDAAHRREVESQRLQVSLRGLAGLLGGACFF
jgi:hypothetical protein